MNSIVLFIREHQFVIHLLSELLVFFLAGVAAYRLGFVIGKGRRLKEIEQRITVLEHLFKEQKNTISEVQ